MNRPLYAQRLNRDVSELFSNNFNCSGSTLSVLQTSDSLQTDGCLILRITIFEGPYRRGSYAFGLNIPENYPFRPVEIYAKQPIWHPNIDLFTGKVALPIEWSPVLTLNSIALAVQMLLLEPSPENPLNMEAYSYFLSQSDTFDQLVQKSISGGCGISGVKFESVLTNLTSSSNSGDFGYPSSASMRSTPTTPLRTDRGGAGGGGMSPISSHVFAQRLAKPPSQGQMEGIGDEPATFGPEQTYTMNMNMGMSINQGQVMGQSGGSVGVGNIGLGSPRTVSADTSAPVGLVSLGLGLGVGAGYNAAHALSSQHYPPPTLLAMHIPAAHTPHGKKRSYEESECEMDGDSGPLEPMRNPFHVYPLHFSTAKGSGMSSAGGGMSGGMGAGMGAGMCGVGMSSNAPSVPGLSRVTSEDWNHRIAQLSLDPSHRNNNSTTSSGNTASVSLQQDILTQQLQRPLYGTNNTIHSISNSNTSTISHYRDNIQSTSISSELDKLNSMSGSNLSGMEVCSPFKRGRASVDLQRPLSMSMVEDV